MKNNKTYKNAPRHIFLSVMIALALTYLIMVILLKYPIKIFYITAVALILANIILFLGNIVGIIAVISQNITGKSPIKLYTKAYNISNSLILYPLSPTLLSAYSLELIKVDEPQNAIEIADAGLYNSRYFAVSKSLMINKGLAFYKLNKIDEAISVYRDILKIFGKENQLLLSSNFDYDAYVGQSETNENKDNENSKKAISLSKIIEENQYFTASDYTSLAYFYILKKELNKAIFFTKLAAKKDEYYAASYDNFGQIAMLQNNEEKAIKYFNKALELYPTLVDSLFYMSKIYLKKGEKEKALDFFNKIDQSKITGLSTVSIKEIKDLEEEF